MQKELAVLKSQKKQPKLHLINLKVNDEDRAAIKRKAKQHAKGNMSVWIRYAATQLSPKKKDVTK